MNHLRDAQYGINMEKLKIGDKIYCLEILYGYNHTRTVEPGEPVTISGFASSILHLWVGVEETFNGTTNWGCSRFSRTMGGKPLCFEDFVERPKFKGCTIRD